MKSVRAICFCATAMMLTSAPAHAASIIVNHVLNPANIGTSISQEQLATPFTAGVGDTVTFNLSFTGGQSVTLNGDTSLWLLSLTNASSALEVTGTYKFLGASGDLATGLVPFNQGNAQIHIGGYLFPSDYRTGPGAITFSGIQEVITINSSTGADPRTYNTISLYTDGRVTATGGAVPEPATWAMMILGFGMVGGAARYRRRWARVAFA